VASMEERERLLEIRKGALASVLPESSEPGSQLNRRIRALEPELKAFQRDVAATLADGLEIYHILDTTLIPAVVRVKACRKDLVAGQATFGRCVFRRPNGSTASRWPSR
jgi:hypothetical protein